MRRLGTGVTTTNHPFYGPFLSRLSSCLFQWSQEDLDLLRAAKLYQLEASGQRNPSAAAVDKSITKKELALHCRRRTRGVQQTFEMITALLRSMWDVTDSLGVRLFDQEKMAHLWEKEQKHLPCIQDPPGFSLYTETGTVKKGGVTLSVYRCARGSVSIESFHNHQNKFVPS